MNNNTLIATPITPNVTPLTHHHPNVELVNLIPLSAKVVLEVGCGSGASGEYYLQQNPTATYIGLELSEEYANIARQHISKCYVGNIENIDIQKICNGLTPDCIVFGDVLEHLVDPWAILKHLKLNLPPNTAIVACVPNVGHWSVLINLLSGQWPYADSGLFDRTHLRFFTKQSLRELFESSGLNVVSLSDRLNIYSQNSMLVPHLVNVASNLGINHPALSQELNVFQYLVSSTT